MTRRTRRNHAPAFKAQVALAALKSDKTLVGWPSSMTFTRTRSRTGSGNSQSVRFTYLETPEVPRAVIRT